MEFTATKAIRDMKSGANIEVLEVTFTNHVGNIFLIRSGSWFRACNRCGGYGHREFCRDYGTYCFDCTGSGLGEPTTEADAVKLMKTRQATLARKNRADFLAAWDRAIEWNAFYAENAEIVKWLAGKDERRGFIGDMARKVAICETLSPKMLEVLDRIMAENAEKEIKVQAAGHFGEVGKREKKITATVKSVKEMPDYGFGISWLISMETAEGHILKTFTSGAFADVKPGETYTFAGTPKEHGEYNGRPETTLSRCALPKAK